MIRQALTSKQKLASFQYGFSLVELAVVVFIVGIILTMGVGALSAARENTAVSATTQKQNAIKEALIGYLRRYSRLPCPDTKFAAPDGVENRQTAGDPTTACTNINPLGILPYVTLGLGREAAQDGWGNFFSYRVANTPGANTDWTTTASFRAGNTGNVTLNDRVGGALTPLATNIAAVVISHGRNGLGAYTVGGTRNIVPTAADELANTDASALFVVKRNVTTDDAASGGAFDDIVMYLTPDDLLGPLFRDGTLKPPAAQLQEAFQKIKLALTGHAMGYSSLYGGTSCTNSASTPKCRIIISADPDGLTGFTAPNTPIGYPPYNDLGLTLADTTDPWGTRIVYVLDPTVTSTSSGGGISSASPSASLPAYRLTSYGPNRALGGGDDISLSVSVAELRASMSSLLP